MTGPEIERWLRKTIAAAARIETIDVGRDDDLSEAIGLDSLSRLEILAEIEEHFDIVFDDEVFDGPNTIDFVVSLISEKLAQKSAQEVNQCASD